VSLTKSFHEDGDLARVGAAVLAFDAKNVVHQIDIT
jgi:hypothetical protein